MALPPLKGGFFFAPTELAQVKEPQLLVPKCGACQLYKKCNSPKMPVSGRGERGVLIVGEAPGRDEDEQGVQFVGKTGQRLRKTLKRLGVDPNRDCWFTNSLICRPPSNKVPDKAVDYCRPSLIKTISELKPHVIVLVGGTAVKSLISHAFKDKKVGGIKQWAGWVIPCRKPNAWIVPTFHPSFIEREERIEPVLQRMFEEHLAAAFQKTSPPWKEVPDYEREVEKVMKPSVAAERIDRFRKSRLIAFDYETDRLKPDHPEAQIVCCSISDGTTTIAYPWIGDAIVATKELLHDPNVGKVAANLKFEERWTRRMFVKGVVNWKWDTVVMAHVLDNRRGIAGLKFQSFVLLGQPDYDSHLKPFLESEGGRRGNVRNRVKEIDLSSLLTYCGVDSLCTYKVAMIQAKQLGVRL